MAERMAIQVPSVFSLEKGVGTVVSIMRGVGGTPEIPIPKDQLYTTFILKLLGELLSLVAFRYGTKGMATFKVTRSVTSS